MKISKSKRQLAQLLIAAGVTKFPEGANWVAQGSVDLKASFYGGYKPRRGFGEVAFCGDYYGRIHDVQLSTLIPNWHQTVLSRDEFDQIVAAEKLPKHVNCRCAMRPVPELTNTPTLDQLLQDWRNADDYAQRKQTEADKAAAMRDERWQAVQARAGEMGVTVGRCEPGVVITDWRDVRCGDYVWVGDSGRTHNCPSGEYEVVEIDVRDTAQPFGVKWNDRVTWPQIHERGWRFIRRP